MNPELHYLDHLQNTSISKNCNVFSKAPRFRDPFATRTDFKYNPISRDRARSCNFGFGKRSELIKAASVPSPNKYNISGFPSNQRTTTLGHSCEEVKFGTLAFYISQKAKLPPPDAYNIKLAAPSMNFTMKQRLPDESTIILKQRFPGPGSYQPIGINSRGRYPTSKFKNVRAIVMDANKTQCQQKGNEVGPGTYDLFNNDSQYSDSKVVKMRTTTTKLFGTGKRKGPEEKHRVYVPGPGLYETFSSFGTCQLKKYNRTKTQYF